MAAFAKILGADVFDSMCFLRSAAYGLFNLILRAFKEAFLDE